MAIADRISAMYDHVGDIYDTMALGGDTTQNKNIVNINTEIKREYKDFLAHGTDVLWNNWEKVSGTGTELSLNNTMEGKMKVDLKGNTQQNGTPTPDTPIDIQVVSGDNTLKVEGKNLFNKNNATILNSYIGPETMSPDNSARSVVIPVEPNTTYTISKSNRGFDSNYYWMERIAEFETTPNTLSSFITKYDNVGLSYTFTTSSNTHYIVYGVAYGNTYISNLQTYLDTIQLEKGSSASEYTPYVSQTYPISLGDIELCKIGDYQDYIYKDNGKWYLHKEIGKVVLDGSESGWVKDEGNPGRYNLPTPNAILGSSTNNPVLSDRFQPRFAISNYSIFLSGANHLICIIYQDITWNVETWKTWLSTHNTTVYYVLATPTYEEITDTTLLSQLEALKEAESYLGQTNISQVNDDLASELDVVALEDI